MGKNWDWSYQKGKQKRLEAERNARCNGQVMPRKPPLHSHDATMQSYFNRGWRSVTPLAIQRYIFESRK